MSENCDTSGNTSDEANDDMVGVHFIDLEEITDVAERQPQESEEQDINVREELRKRLRQAEASCRTKRKLNDYMSEDRLKIEGVINEMAAENKYLTNKVTELQQQVTNIRKGMEPQTEEEEFEEALHQELLSKEESNVKSQVTDIEKMEKENRKLREKNEDLTAELDKLSLGEKYQEDIQNLRRVEQEFKHKLEEVQDVLRSKDEEIGKKSIAFIQGNSEIEEYFDTIEDLRQDQRELRQQLSSRQEEQILAALNFQEESTTNEAGVFKCCAKGLWKGIKVAGVIALYVLLPMGIMASMAPVCNSRDPDYNLWNIVFDLLEPYSELHHTLPPVY